MSYLLGGSIPALLDLTLTPISKKHGNINLQRQRSLKVGEPLIAAGRGAVAISPGEILAAIGDRVGLDTHVEFP